MSKLSIIEKALKDPVFRGKLKRSPTEICREEGADFPAGASIHLIESRPMEIHFFVGVKTKSPEVNAVLERAEKDSQFSQQLCDHPHEVLTELAGLQIAPGSKVTVHPASETQIYLMLPDQESNALELSESELETVSGGGLFKNLINRLCGDHTLVVIDKTGTYTTYTDPSIGSGNGSGGSIATW